VPLIELQKISNCVPVFLLNNKRSRRAVIYSTVLYRDQYTSFVVDFAKIASVCTDAYNRPRQQGHL